MCISAPTILKIQFGQGFGIIKACASVCGWVWMWMRVRCACVCGCGGVRGCVGGVCGGVGA